MELIVDDKNNKKNNKLHGNSVSENILETKDPVLLFHKWFNLAHNDTKTVGADYMCLATATKSGIPSARLMTLKEYSNDGFIFFTHYSSRKSKEIEENPNAALVFYWDQFGRSVRIEGTVEKVSCCKSDEYFRKRSYDSQIAANICEQSKPIEDQSVLACRSNKLRKKYPVGQVPRPPHWGGFIIRPHTIEFWQGRKDSLHDRIRFRRPSEKEPDGVLTHEAEDGWVYERLCP